ncbi:MAG: biotin transporter BioY [Clostridia bacterium]|nr:biotin transporter BioY [Clostridia bacterium]
MNVRSLVLTALFAALTAVGAYLAIPNPLAAGVPFTLQVFAIFLAGSLIGPRLAFLSQVVYLALGAAGAPVFAGGAGGIVHFVAPSGGYLFAFPVMAWIIGAIAGREPGWWRLVLANLAGVATSWLLGGAGIALFGHVPWGAAYEAAAVFVPYDAVKAVLAATLALAVRRALGPSSVRVGA